MSAIIRSLRTISQQNGVRLLSTSAVCTKDTAKEIKDRVAEDAYATEDQASVADHSKGTGNHPPGAGPQDPVGKSFSPEVSGGQVGQKNIPAGGTAADQQVGSGNVTAGGTAGNQKR